MPSKASLLSTFVVLFGLVAVPATSARADLISPGNQLWQQGSGGLADEPEGEDRAPTGVAGVYRSRGDAFGQVVASGDFNGDGVKDVAVGAPDEDAPVENVEENADYSSLDPGIGAVTIIYGARGEGGLNSTVRPDQLFTPASDGLDATPATAAQEFGYALAAGDLNGDRADDLAIGVPGNRGGGVVVLYSTGPGGPNAGLTTTGAQFWSQDSTGIHGGSEADDRFGAALATATFSGDGYADLAIGAPGEDDEAGAVNVIYGSSGGLGPNFNQMWDQNSDGIEGGAEGIDDNCSAGFLCGDVRGDNFGWSLAAGDYDSNGRQDLAIGVPYERTDQGEAGAVSVIYSNGNGLASANDQFFEQGSDRDAVDGTGHGDERFGWSLAAGRFSNYGGDSLAIGVPGDDSGAGAVNVIYSSPHGLDPSAIADQRWTQNSDGIEGAQEEHDLFGKSVAAGRFRGTDDLDALAIGVPGEDEQAGAVAVLYPDEGGVIRELRAGGDQLWQQGYDGLQGRRESNDQLGSALATGDLDGNGAEDLVAGARFEDDHAGAINAIYSARPAGRGDRTPPSVTETVSGRMGRNGWYIGDVVVTFAASDPESPILSQSGCDRVMLTSDGVKELTCRARSAGGVSTRSVTIRRDTVAPTLTATRTPTNAAGWSKDDVRVEFTCADEQSGVDVCTPPRTVSSEGRGQSVLGAAEDRAGHAVHLTVDAINIDKTPPGVGAGRTQANRAGWNNSDVDIEFECGDELSGVASCPGPQQLTQEGAEQTAVGIATDRAGNAQAFDYRHINIDKTPPTITAKRAPALDADGKPTGATAAVFTCSDALSGVLSCPDPVVLDDDDPGKSVSGTATDRAGNTVMQELPLG